LDKTQLNFKNTRFGSMRVGSFPALSSERDDREENSSD